MTALANRLRDTDLAFLVAQAAHELTMRRRGYPAGLDFAAVLAQRLRDELFEAGSGERRKLAPSVEHAYASAVRHLSASRAIDFKDVGCKLHAVIDCLIKLGKNDVLPSEQLDDLLEFMEVLYAQLIAEQRRDKSTRVRARYA